MLGEVRCSPVYRRGFHQADVGHYSVASETRLHFINLVVDTPECARKGSDPYLDYRGVRQEIH